MAQDDDTPLMEPYVLYLFEEDGITKVLAIFEGLGLPFNEVLIRPALYKPRTPDMVRAALYNKLFRGPRKDNETYVQSAKLHTLPSGFKFFSQFLGDFR